LGWEVAFSGERPGVFTKVLLGNGVGSRSKASGGSGGRIGRGVKKVPGKKKAENPFRVELKV